MEKKKKKGEKKPVKFLFRGVMEVSVFVNRGAGSFGAAYQHKQTDITGGGADGVNAPSITA